MKTLLLFILVAAPAGIAIADTNMTGKWTGSFNMMDENGGTRNRPPSLMLKQTGSEITGTVGPDEGEQHAITKGKIDGDKITLNRPTATSPSSSTCHPAGDRITGNVNAVGEGRGLKAKFDVTRAK